MQFSTGNTFYAPTLSLLSGHHLRAIWNGAVNLAGTSTNAGFIVFEKNRLATESAFLLGKNVDVSKISKQQIE